MSRRYNRPTTAPEECTPERNARHLDYHATRLDKIEERVTFLDGGSRDLEHGYIGRVKADQEKSAQRQGERIGAVEAELKTTQTLLLDLQNRDHELDKRVEVNKWKTRGAIALLGAGGAGAVELAMKLLGG